MRCRLRVTFLLECDDVRGLQVDGGLDDHDGPHRQRRLHRTRTDDELRHHQVGDDQKPNQDGCHRKPRVVANSFHEFHS